MQKPCKKCKEDSARLNIKFKIASSRKENGNKIIQFQRVEKYVERVKVAVSITSIIMVKQLNYKNIKSLLKKSKKERI